MTCARIISAPLHRYASLTIAITMPASTQTTVSTCIQIQKGDMTGQGYCCGSFTTVTKNSSICRTTSMKRSKSTGLVTYAFACSW
jgi:hypothetical protein